MIFYKKEIVSLINKYKQEYKGKAFTCIGITLFRFFSCRIELWFCPSGFEIVEHAHKDEDVELIYLYGNCIFYRRDLNDGKVIAKYMNLMNLFKKFTVKHYHSHWFTVGNKPLIFLNYQKFLKGKQVRSASEDFSITTI